jgi:EAL domain-containing protein (putative c-di-GMP-specific phosphodiesterase class I)/GGDEF domain-containing protein
VHVSLRVDREGRILQSRPRALGAFGRRASDVVGKYASDLFVADDMLSARALLHRATRDGATDPVRLRFRGADDTEIVARVSARGTTDGSTGSLGVHIRACDDVEQDVFRAAAGERARFDPLTGLPNRLLLLERICRARDAGPHALVLLDVDHFRHLVTALGPRIGGAPLSANGDAIELSTCLGVAVAATSTDAETLFADAEVALAQAKSLGPARSAVFDPAFRRRAVHQIELQSELSRAVLDNDLRLDFQPIVKLETDAIVGYEALVRRQHPSRGRLAPRDFLGIAQRTGAGAAIDDWVLIEACRQGATWGRSGNVSTVCVNVTPERFAIGGFVDRVERTLATTGLDPSCLVIEITEWSILVDVDAARDTLAALKALGVRVALDDYGTGYSSLADDAALPVDEIKIDISFVAGLSTDRARTAIVHAIVGLGHALAVVVVVVVVEGVETAAQAFALRALGCDFGQGFHFGRPASRPALTARTA